MRIIAEGTALTYNVATEVTYTREFVPLLNDAALVDEAFAAARAVFESDHISAAHEPMTGSEDFAQFLEHVPGCFVFVGNGEHSAPLHNPSYDFNDAGLLYGDTLPCRHCPTAIASGVTITDPILLSQPGVLHGPFVRARPYVYQHRRRPQSA
jgi:metal-dependent amidase/aminoacylase/carboxypeptidase family protein